MRTFDELTVLLESLREKTHKEQMKHVHKKIGHKRAEHKHKKAQEKRRSRKLDRDLHEEEKRDYKKEYRKYHGTAEYRKKRSNRVMARRKMVKKHGKAKLAGKDVDHKNGNAYDNSPSNLRVMDRHKNRSRNNNKGR
jgi:hypothetical protein